jgi:hypothetical protein
MGQVAEESALAHIAATLKPNRTMVRVRTGTQGNQFLRMAYTLLIDVTHPLPSRRGTSTQWEVSSDGIKLICRTEMGEARP